MSTRDPAVASREAGANPSIVMLIAIGAVAKVGEAVGAGDVARRDALQSGCGIGQRNDGTLHRKASGIEHTPGNLARRHRGRGLSICRERIDNPKGEP